MKVSKLTEFNELGLAAPILKALTDEGYVTPTPIQAQAIPAIMTGRDLLGIAQTGTGKTAAFALPVLNYLASNRRAAPRFGARVLVLAPTRELAGQIAESFRTYGKHMQVSVATVFGGVPHGPQIRALARGLDILVATPGRLVDHLDARTASLGGVEFLVLDEVDRMLDLGFINPIKRITKLLPKQRQNLFFSATLPGEIGALAAELLTDPVKVSVAPVASTAERVRQEVILVDGSNKRSALVKLFDEASMTRTIVFTRTKHGADKVEAHLTNAGIISASIHGNKSQGQRERALAAFRNGKVRALVATDIAARGIDVDAVSHVVNFDLPEVAENYVHRIGRTARAGAEGVAISLCASDELNLLRQVERLTRMKLQITDQRSSRAPGDAPIDLDAIAPQRTHRKPSFNRGGGHESRSHENRGYAPRGAGGGHDGEASRGRFNPARPNAARRQGQSAGQAAGRSQGNAMNQRKQARP